MKLVMIDNYDSFTFNLVQYFGELGEDVRVARNDEITLDEIAALKPDRICTVRCRQSGHSAKRLGYRSIPQRRRAWWIMCSIRSI